MSKDADIREDVELMDVNKELAAWKNSPACIHNFGGEAVDVWRMTALATGGSCKDGRDLIDQVFPLRYFFIHPATINTEDRGVVTSLRTVLMDENGDAYGFTSKGIYDSLRILVQQLGDVEGAWPIAITVRETQRKGNRRFYTIEPAPVRHGAAEGE